MPYFNPRGLGVSDIGPTLVTLCACTLADYAASGTTTPVVGDTVTFSATGNHYVKRCPDNQVAKFGRVTKIELAPTGTDLGFLVVEWLDVVRFVRLTIDDLSPRRWGMPPSRTAIPRSPITSTPAPPPAT